MHLLPQLRSILKELPCKVHYVLLIVDDTDLLTPVLLGQPDLAHKLRVAPLPTLPQRIAVRSHLKPNDLEESAGYVKHHLRVVGIKGDLYSDGFIVEVYDHTKGMARQVNSVCRGALPLGATETEGIFDGTDHCGFCWSLYASSADGCSLPSRRPLGASFLVRRSVDPLRPTADQKA
jgi:type II secretory pathway predicted ATPase ExeA